MRGILFFGLIIIIIGVILSLNPLSTIRLFSTSYQSIDLFSNINNTTTNLNLSFDFNPSYISDYYTISNGEKLQHTYINIFCNQLKDDTTSEELTYLKLNDNLYIPANKSYETSLAIVEGILNSNSDLQHLQIMKSADLTINKITLEYYGINYINKDIYDKLSITITFIIIFAGILLLATGSKL